LSDQESEAIILGIANSKFRLSREEEYFYLAVDGKYTIGEPR
jgi:hypothetical protein